MMAPPYNSGDRPVTTFIISRKIRQSDFFSSDSCCKKVRTSSLPGCVLMVPIFEVVQFIQSILLFQFPDPVFLYSGGVLGREGKENLYTAFFTLKNTATS